jgi:hypothetical protein
LILVGLAVVVCSALAAAIHVPSASALDWDCGTYSGTTVEYCNWGYDWLNSSSGEQDSPWNYWYEQQLNKNNGGTIQIGVGPTDGCDVNRSGSGSWDVVISTYYGCGGYIYSYHAYESGDESYMQVIVTTAT